MIFLGFENKNSRFITVLVFCLSIYSLSLGAAAGLFAANVNTIVIPEQVEIDDDRILLGKIARIEGEDHWQVQKLRDIVIGNAPLPGKSRQIDERYIRLRLKQHGVDLSQTNVQVPDKVAVSRGFTEISKEKIEKIVLDYLYKEIGKQRKDANVKSVQVDYGIILPRGNITYEIVRPKDAELMGLMSLSVSFNVNGRLHRRVSVGVYVEVFAEVVAANRPLRRNKLISEGDIYLKKMDLARLSSNIITDVDDVLGKRTKRAIDSNVVLRTDHVELPPLVNRGDVVYVIAESKQLRITTRGVVKQRGRHGDMIRVENIDSSKSIYAYVLDENTVKVAF